MAKTFLCEGCGFRCAEDQESGDSPGLCLECAGCPLAGGLDGADQEIDGTVLGAGA